MGEKSEVQNLTDPTVATEPLDATPAASDVNQVEQGEPKDYPDDVGEDDDAAYPSDQPPSR